MKQSLGRASKNYYKRAIINKLVVRIENSKANTTNVSANKFVKALKIQTT